MRKSKRKDLEERKERSVHICVPTFAVPEPVVSKPRHSTLLNFAPPPTPPVASRCPSLDCLSVWSCEDVCNFVRSLGLPWGAFEDYSTTGKELLKLEQADLTSRFDLSRDQAFSLREAVREACRATLLSSPFLSVYLEQLQDPSFFKRSYSILADRSLPFSIFPQPHSLFTSALAGNSHVNLYCTILPIFEIEETLGKVMETINERERCIVIGRKRVFVREYKNGETIIAIGEEPEEKVVDNHEVKEEKLLDNVLAKVFCSSVKVQRKVETSQKAPKSKEEIQKKRRKAFLAAWRKLDSQQAFDITSNICESRREGAWIEIGSLRTIQCAKLALTVDADKLSSQVSFCCRIQLKSERSSPKLSFRDIFSDDNKTRAQENDRGKSKLPQSGFVSTILVCSRPLRIQTERTQKQKEKSSPVLVEEQEQSFTSQIRHVEKASKTECAQNQNEKDQSVLVEERQCSTTNQVQESEKESKTEKQKEEDLPALVEEPQWSFASPIPQVEKESKSEKQKEEDLPALVEESQCSSLKCEEGFLSPCEAHKDLSNESFKDSMEEGEDSNRVHAIEIGEKNGDEKENALDFADSASQGDDGSETESTFVPDNADDFLEERYIVKANTPTTPPLLASPKKMESSPDADLPRTLSRDGTETRMVSPQDIKEEKRESSVHEERKRDTSPHFLHFDDDFEQLRNHTPRQVSSRPSRESSWFRHHDLQSIHSEETKCSPLQDKPETDEQVEYTEEVGESFGQQLEKVQPVMNNACSPAQDTSETGGRVEAVHVLGESEQHVNQRENLEDDEEERDDILDDPSLESTPSVRVTRRRLKLETRARAEKLVENYLEEKRQRASTPKTKKKKSKKKTTSSKGKVSTHQHPANDNQQEDQSQQRDSKPVARKARSKVNLTAEPKYTLEQQNRVATLSLELNKGAEKMRAMLRCIRSDLQDGELCREENILASAHELREQAYSLRDIALTLKNDVGSKMPLHCVASFVASQLNRKVTVSREVVGDLETAIKSLEESAHAHTQ